MLRSGASLDSGLSEGFGVMTNTEMEERLENLDLRLARVEQILPSLATKDDLKAFATKDDLRDALVPYATKEDLRRALVPYATKEDLRQALVPYATKEDLRQALVPYATKKDLDDGLEETRRYIRVLFEDLVERIKVLGEHRRKRR
jgi:hypothetical protein